MFMSHGHLTELSATKQAPPRTSREASAQPHQRGLHSPILQLQRRLGNQGMGRLIRAASHAVGSPLGSGRCDSVSPRLDRLGDKALLALLQTQAKLTATSLGDPAGRGAGAGTLQRELDRKDKEEE